VVEGTGGDHQAVGRALHDAGRPVCVAHPARARPFAQSQGLLTQNDMIGAFALARFGQTTELCPWHPPPPEVELPQALAARREALAPDPQREKNRLEKADVTHSPRFILASIKKHFRFLEKALARMDDDIDRFLRDPRLREADALLQSLPGVGPRTSTTMLCVLLHHSFDSAEQAAASLGLTPVGKPSGSSGRERSQLSKNGPAKVRATLSLHGRRQRPNS
jgi:transposase